MPVNRLRDLISEICRKLLDHEDYDPGCARGKYSPLSGTAWSNRSSDWFRSAPFEMPSRVMREHEFKILRSQLVEPVDRDGNRIIRENDISALDKCYKDYRANVVVVNAHVSNAFVKMLRVAKIDRKTIKDLNVFRCFLFEQIYGGDVVSSNFSAARDKLLLVLSALNDNKAPIYKDDTDREHMIISCLALLAYLGFVSEDGSEGQFVERLAKIHDHQPNLFLQARLLTHRGHHTVDPEPHLKVLDMRLANCNLDIQTYSKVASSAYHNAARACLQNGMTATDRVLPSSTLTIQELIEEGLEENLRDNDTDACIRHEILNIMGLLNANQLSGALQKAGEIRDRYSDSIRNMPRIEIRLNRLESSVYFALSQKGERHAHYAAIDKIRNAENLCKNLNLCRSLSMLEKQKEWIVRHAANS